MNTVVAAVTDIFFVAKIQPAVRQAGAEMKLASSSADTLDKARAGAKLVILDLNDRSIAPLEVIAGMKADETLRNVPVVCFLSHVYKELKQQAEEAGADEVLLRSVFSKKLPEVLARYTG